MLPTAATREDAVVLFVGGRKGIRQPEGFRVCPLGIQFYAPKPVARYKLLDFNISVAGNGRSSGRIRCCGAVVHCRRDTKEHCYRIWVKFLDLPKSKERQLQCVAKTARTLCPYCENF